MRWLRLALVLIAMLGVSSAQAGWKTAREALDQRLVSGSFGIYYTLSGTNVFPAGSTTPNPTLADTYVRQLAQQLVDADTFYRASLGFRHPFAGTRYASVKSIDVHIMYLGSTKGSTGDEINEFAYKSFPTNPAAVSIALTSSWQPSNVTPAHELMHVYQNSYTFFKNPWFTEGMARASEGFFRTRETESVSLPQTSFELDDLLLQTYDAETFWNRLMALCGKTILKPVLVNFNRLDRQAALARGIDPAGWPEDEQWATENNLYLLKGLVEAIQQNCPARESAELRQFVTVAKQATAGLVVSQSPGLTDADDFTARVEAMGGATSIQSDGRVEVNLAGVTYSGWPGWDADACSQRGIFSTAEGLFRFGNGQTCQSLYPAAADPAVIDAIVSAMDVAGDVEFEETAHLKISFNGQHLTLFPAYALTDLPAANANKTYWVESDGRLWIAYPARGKAQAFTLQ